MDGRALPAPLYSSYVFFRCRSSPRRRLEQGASRGDVAAKNAIAPEPALRALGACARRFPTKTTLRRLGRPRALGGAVSAARSSRKGCASKPRQTQNPRREDLAASPRRRETRG